MKIRMKYKLSFSEVDRLIDRYYEGLTTVKEEKLLRNFLSQSDLPTKYTPEQAIFGYFETKKQKTHFTIKPYIRWASVAAIVVFAFVGVTLLTTENQQSYAYVDGIKITDVKEIKLQALASMDDISTENNEVENAIDNVKDNELVKTQLNVFAQ